MLAGPIHSSVLMQWREYFITVQYINTILVCILTGALIHSVTTTMNTGCAYQMRIESLTHMSTIVLCTCNVH